MGDRLAVFPTRQNLQLMKFKLVGAKKGHSLLKKKADALTMRLRLLLRTILEAKEAMGLAFKEGNFALAEVKYAAGDIKHTVIENVGHAHKKMETRIDNIAGVKVPVFKAIETPVTTYDHTGLAKGGEQIKKAPPVPQQLSDPHPQSPPPLPPRPRHPPTQARATFSKVVDVLVQLATLQTSFVILDQARPPACRPAVPRSTARGPPQLA